KSMTELYKDTTEGIDWKKDTRNVGKSVLIAAPHGGNIEQGTSELTKLVANNGDFDYFSFEAIRPSNNTQLHVTSTNYNEYGYDMKEFISNKKFIAMYTLYHQEDKEAFLNFTEALVYGYWRYYMKKDAIYMEIDSNCAILEPTPVRCYPVYE